MKQSKKRKTEWDNAERELLQRGDEVEKVRILGGFRLCRVNL